MSINDTITEALAQKHLNFKVDMAENYAMIDGVFQPTGMFTPIRSDKSGKDRIIGAHAFSSRFTPIQNADAFSIIQDMAELADIEFKHMGSWGNGAGVYAQVQIDGTMEIGNTGDTVGKYLSLVNAHDGSRALSVLVTPYRFWCENQISKAIKAAQMAGTIVSIRHDNKSIDKMKELALTMDHARGIFIATETEYRMLADKVITMDHVQEAMARAYPYAATSKGEPSPNWVNRVLGMVKRFNYADGGRTERLTAWNLYNAIQGTIQHDSRHTNSYDKSVLFGDIAKRSGEALSIVTSVADSLVKTDHPEFNRLFKAVA